MVSASEASLQFRQVSVLRKLVGQVRSRTFSLVREVDPSVLRQFEVDDAKKESLIKELGQDRIWPNPIVTEVEPIKTFFPAEDYHQHYFRDNARQPYCQVVIAPKLNKLRKRYAERLVSGSTAH